jgi:predicted GNAT family acetyltransferase
MPQYSFLEIEIAGKATTVCHALEGNQVVATCSVQSRGMLVANIARLFVMPEHRRKGIATTLVQQCCAFASDNGSEAVAVSIEVNNRCVIPFYTKLKFRLSWEWPDGELLYALALSGPVENVRVE